MKKIFLTTVIVGCIMLCGCNKKPAKEQQGETINNPELTVPDEGPQNHNHRAAPNMKKVAENAKTYQQALDYLGKQHPDFENWDASVVLDSIARYADPTYDRSTKHMGITWKEMRSMRKDAKGAAGK